MRTLAALPLLLIGAVLLPTEVWGATYYVDTELGSDSNSGTSLTLAWRTIPGTRTKNDSGWLVPAWGGVTQTSKIKPGDSIYIKAGGTMSSAIGGKLVVDQTYYENGTQTAPIVIQVSPSWGSGHFTYSAAGMTNPRYFAIVDITRRDFIALGGADESRRFVVLNALGDWAIQIYGSASTHSRGQTLRYVEVANSLNGGVNLALADDWIVSNSSSHDNGSIGFAVGSISDDRTDNGRFIDSVAYANGLAAGPTAIAHGFGLYGGIGIRYERCRSYGNGRDGFDFGTATNTNDSSATVVDSASYDNREDGFGVNGGRNTTNRADYVNTIAFNNGTSGWQIYNGADVGIYHSIAHSNGDGASFGGNVLIYAEDDWPAPKLTLKNNIFYKPKRYAQFGSYGRTSTDLPVIVSDYNLFVPRLGNTETFAEYPYGTQHSYTAPPSWIGTHDKLGITFDPGFVQVSPTNFNGNDYRLTAASGPAINGGAALPAIPDAARDRSGTLRSSPPEIGAFEFVSGRPLFPTEPSNLRLSP